MKVELKRIALKDNYTIGRLFVDGAYVCDTIEDKVRDIDKNGKFNGSERKIYAQTAIPYGTYEVAMNIISPRFSQRSFYYKNCNHGCLPRLLGVNSFDGILIHCGNTQDDSAGCIIVGYNKIVGRVVDSQEAFLKLYNLLDSAHRKGEQITITIV